MVIRFGGRNAPAKFGLNFVRTNTLIRDSDGRGRDEDFSLPSPGGASRAQFLYYVCNLMIVF
jgi:hypothetical protein